jgi:OmpA-OmpF porin, OOP family
VNRGSSALLGISGWLALTAPPAALAQDAGFYLGGSLGQATFTEWCVDSPSVLSCDDKDSAWKIFGGYRFNRYVAVEGTYINWGKATGTVGPPARDVSAEQTSMGVAAVGSFELTPQFSVFGKAGFLMTEQETPAASVTKRDETEFHYGLGLRFRFAPNWAARGEWERTEKLKVEMLSIGVEYRF